MAETAGFWLKMGLWGFLIFGVLFLVGGIFWLMMLIHALSNPIPNKIMWVAVIFFISLVGAIIYYFVIKRKCVAVFVPPVVTQTVPNTSPVPTAPTIQSSIPTVPVRPTAPVAPAMQSAIPIVSVDPTVPMQPSTPLNTHPIPTEIPTSVVIPPLVPVIPTPPTVPPAPPVAPVAPSLPTL
jgi:Phospholipase_D-nuclease N-terminal